MKTIYKDGHRYVETEDEGYWIELPQMRDGPLTIIEMLDGNPLYEISVLPEEINGLVYALLEAKRLNDDG